MGDRLLPRSVAGDIRRMGREVEFSGCDASFWTFGGAFRTEFDDEDVGALCLGSNGRKMGSIGAAGAEIGVAGDDTRRAADDDRFH